MNGGGDPEPGSEAIAALWRQRIETLSTDMSSLP
jgi:hypothetical protein